MAVNTEKSLRKEENLNNRSVVLEEGADNSMDRTFHQRRSFREN